VALVSIGSAYYHWVPGDARLVWDRLPMTIGFMGAYVALLAEYVDARLERLLLLPAALLGLASVVYWDLFGDLRLYFAVQAMSLGSLLAIIGLFTSRHGGRPWIVAACAAYAMAILCEQLDHQVFGLTGGTVSGHTIKHVFAALAPLAVFLMLRRRLLPAGDPA